MRKKHLRVLLAMGWYEQRVHQGIANYALKAGWHLCPDVTKEKVIPWCWGSYGILAWLGLDEDLTRFVLEAKLPTVDFSRPPAGTQVSPCLGATTPPRQNSWRNISLVRGGDIAAVKLDHPELSLISVSQAKGALQELTASLRCRYGLRRALRVEDRQGANAADRAARLGGAGADRMDAGAGAVRLILRSRSARPGRSAPCRSRSTISR